MPRASVIAIETQDEDDFENNDPGSVQTSQPGDNQESIVPRRRFRDLYRVSLNKAG